MITQASSLPESARFSPIEEIVTGEGDWKKFLRAILDVFYGEYISMTSLTPISPVPNSKSTIYSLRNGGHAAKPSQPGYSAACPR
jgi:hypothetical protein